MLRIFPLSTVFFETAGKKKISPQHETIRESCIKYKVLQWERERERNSKTRIVLIFSKQTQLCKTRPTNLAVLPRETKSLTFEFQVCERGSGSRQEKFSSVRGAREAGKNSWKNSWKKEKRKQRREKGVWEIDKRTSLHSLKETLPSGFWLKRPLSLSWKTFWKYLARNRRRMKNNGKKESLMQKLCCDPKISLWINSLNHACFFPFQKQNSGEGKKNFAENLLH